MDKIGNDTNQSDYKYVRYFMNQPLLERDNEHELAKLWKEEGQETALHEIIQSYTRLVVSMAVGYKRYGLPISELIQEGIIGLLEAANRYEPEREIRFSAYAKWWVKSHMQDYILRNWSIVRIGSTTTQKVLFFNLARIRRELGYIEAEFIDDPTIQAELAKEMGVPLKDVKSMEERLSLHDLSLNLQVGDNPDDTLMHYLKDNGLDPEEMSIITLDGLRRVRWIKKALDCLNDREKFIITKRRLSDPGKTLEDVGKDLRITKERVRQLETKALRKMRYFLISNVQEARQFLS